MGRPGLVPGQQNAEPADPADGVEDAPLRKGTRYRPWAELLKRTFQIDVLCCPSCHGRMKLIAMVTDPKSITRFLHGLEFSSQVVGKAHELSTDARCTEPPSTPFDRDRDDLFEDAE